MYRMCVVSLCALCRLTRLLEQPNHKINSSLRILTLIIFIRPISLPCIRAYLAPCTLMNAPARTLSLGRYRVICINKCMDEPYIATPVQYPEPQESCVSQTV